MPSIQIKNVPAEVHETLQRLARNQGKSLQEYLLSELARVARQDSLGEILDRARSRQVDVSSDEIVKIIREDRESH